MNVIYAGTDGFDAMLYPEQSYLNTEYIQSQFENFSSTLNDIGRQFIQGAKDVYEEINNSQAMIIARNALRAVKGMFNQNTIIPLSALEDFQIAQPIMQRYIMANPVIREIYNNQRCDGYQDTYVDIQPGYIGENHYDYRRVMNGLAVETEDSWEINFYPDELLEGDSELTHIQQVDILSTWRVMEMFISEGKDPTNIYGGKIG